MAAGLPHRQRIGVLLGSQNSLQATCPGRFGVLGMSLPLGFQCQFTIHGSPPKGGLTNGTCDLLMHLSAGTGSAGIIRWLTPISSSAWRRESREHVGALASPSGWPFLVIDQQGMELD